MNIASRSCGLDDTAVVGLLLEASLETILYVSFTTTLVCTQCFGTYHNCPYLEHFHVFQKRVSLNLGCSS